MRARTSPPGTASVRRWVCHGWRLATWRCCTGATRRCTTRSPPCVRLVASTKPDSRSMPTPNATYAGASGWLVCFRPTGWRRVWPLRSAAISTCRPCATNIQKNWCRLGSALRDVGRALGIDAATLDRVSAGLARWDHDLIPLEALAEAGLDPADRRTRQWLALTERLIGLPRHLSQHVGGFVISRGPLHELVPVENARMAGRSVIQWDKDDLEALGLLKVDVLALGMLSALRRALDLLRSHPDWRGRELALHTLPPECPATYAMLQRGQSLGVFQVESRA
ncbi:MAG: hypothetical protein EBS54_09485, partial [Betaproteobacteria bacterium]|nr:hypothetical protein [Betaproteobacteria bacterium]